MSNALERIKFIAGSTIDNIISKFENPISQIDNAIVDAKIAYSKIKQEGASALAKEAQCRRDYEADLSKATAMHETAVKAAKAGNENDAKQALEAEQKYVKSAEAKKQVLDATTLAADKLRAALKEYQDGIKDMEAKKAEIVAKQAAANAIKEVNKMTEVPYQGADSAFARLQAKADAEYEQAIAESQINKDIADGNNSESDLMKKYNSFNDTQGVNEAYNALLKEIGK